MLRALNMRGVWGGKGARYETRNPHTAGLWICTSFVIRVGLRCLTCRIPCIACMHTHTHTHCKRECFGHRLESHWHALVGTGIGDGGCSTSARMCHRSLASSIPSPCTAPHGTCTSIFGKCFRSRPCRQPGRTGMCSQRASPSRGRLCHAWFR